MDNKKSPKQDSHHAQFKPSRQSQRQQFAKAEIPPEELSRAQAHTCAEQVVTGLSARFRRPKVAHPQQDNGSK